MLPPRLTLFATAVVVLTGSGCRDRQESAHEGLRESSRAFTISDFVKAAGEGRMDLTQNFLEAGMNPNVSAPDGRTALIAAAVEGHGEVVQQLLRQGARATARPSSRGSASDSPTLTPLLAAVRGGDERSVSALLQAGASPSAEGPPEQVPITAAALLGHAAIVEVLAPHCRDSLDTALRLASAKGHTAVMDVLLNAGASLNTTDKSGRTPLMLAASAGEMAAVKLLCHRQADVAIRDSEGRTAADLAGSAGHSAPAAFLSDWSQRPAEPGVFPKTSSSLLANASGSSSIESLEASASGPDASPGESASAAAAGLSSDAPPASGKVPVSSTSKTAFAPPPAPASASPVPPADHEETSLSTDLRTIAGARFLQLHCDAVNDLPHVLAMVSFQRRPWPLLLKDVDPGHEAADIELTLDDRKVVSLRQGAEIPGTGCVIDKLRRRRVFTGSGKDQKLVNASELVFRCVSTGETFRAAPNTPVLSSDSCAHLRVAGSPALWTAAVGNEFRMGTTLLKITAIESRSLTLENRLTKETITVPLSPAT